MLHVGLMLCDVLSQVSVKHNSAPYLANLGRLSRCCISGISSILNVGIPPSDSRQCLGGLCANICSVNFLSTRYLPYQHALNSQHHNCHVVSLVASHFSDSIYQPVSKIYRTFLQLSFSLNTLATRSAR